MSGAISRRARFEHIFKKKSLNLKVNILLVEPYYTGSHKQWADGYKENSSHNVKILSLKGQFWKWRMHGGAITLARMFNDLKWDPDLIFVTDHKGNRFLNGNMLCLLFLIHS